MSNRMQMWGWGLRKWATFHFTPFQYSLLEFSCSCHVRRPHGRGSSWQPRELSAGRQGTRASLVSCIKLLGDCAGEHLLALGGAEELPRRTQSTHRMNRDNAWWSLLSSATKFLEIYHIGKWWMSHNVCHLPYNVLEIKFCWVFVPLSISFIHVFSA